MEQLQIAEIAKIIYLSIGDPYHRRQALKILELSGSYGLSDEKTYAALKSEIHPKYEDFFTSLARLLLR